MKNTLLLKIILCFMFISNAQTEYPQNFFSSPIDMKIAVAGTFGELRNNHFHSGIDIKTKQKKNIPIYATQDGHIARIKVSTYGFGKTIYIQHQNGFTTVYAHLERFNKTIQKRALKEHYKKESFEIDFSLQEDEIKVKKGEIIGFSGNTGNSTGPHLHFEIRDTKTQKIMNPILFNLPILDTSFPVIKSILLYHKNGRKESLNLKKINKKTYTINDTIITNGPFNIGINTYDLLDAAPNKNGIYSMKLYVNDSLIFENKMDIFSFHETKYINSHIDYEYHKNNDIKYQKCFLDPNNKLSTNEKAIKQPIGTGWENGIYEIKIIIGDAHQNHSLLKFNIQLNHNILNKINNNDINCKQVFEFENENCKIYIPNNSLYRDYKFNFETKIDTNLQYPIYKILDDSIPSHKSFIISIKEDSLDVKLREKAMIAKIKNENFNCIKSKWEANSIIGKSNQFGAFTIVIDTIKPVIQNVKHDSIKIELQIYDELSGIAEYRAEIDGKWVLMEYDFKTKIIKHIFEKKPENKNHEFNFKVSDNAGNTNKQIINFFR